jgi:pilus assembly protein FimV
MKIKTLSLAIATSCLTYFLNYSGAYAAGLGKLTVLSALGQPLRAEIELTSVSAEDVGNLFPKLADNEAYRQAKIDFNPVLLSLHFAVENRGSKQFILVTSPQSINEPYLEMLVELTSSSGRLVREYPMVIDMDATPSTNAAVVDDTKTSATGITTNPITATALDKQNVTQKTEPKKTSTKSKDNPKSAVVAQSNSKQASYRIKPGDTLGQIAKHVKYEGVSLDQMLVALQRSNASALINNNMNLIRSGAILTIPDKSEVEGVDKSDAKKVVVAQAIDFEAYRDKLAHQVAQSEPDQTRKIKKSKSGKITAKVVEKPTAINESPDILQLSKAQKQEQAQLKKLEEDRIAEKKELEATNARIKELEQNTAQLQKILALQNEAATKPAQTEKKNTDVADATSIPKAITPIEAKVPTPHAPEQAKKDLAPKPAESKQSLFDHWKRYVPFGAILLALLAGVGIYFSLNRKKTGKKKTEQVVDKISATGATDATDLHSQQVEADSSAETTEENATTAELIKKEDDPLTEADAYIAYGRDDQAEEILKEALNTQSDQHSIRMKLLDIYARRKDALNFGLAASELYEMTGGKGPDWEQAASLGMTIDPNNPLYSNEQSTHHAGIGGDVNLANELASALSDHEDSSKGEKTDMPISPINLDLSASTSQLEELVQVETSSHTQEKNENVETLNSLNLGSTVTTPTPKEFDLSGIDLELPNKRSQAPTQTTLEEMATKLDLALAYKKIGDKEGARELLGEVMNAGTQEQAARAKAMMSDLA